MDNKMKSENRIRLEMIEFLKMRLKELEISIKKSSNSPNIKRFTLETYLTTKKIIEELQIEQETKAIQASKDLWDQGF